MDRRLFVKQSLAGAVAILARIQCDRELRIDLKDNEVLCDTGSDVLRIGSYQITFRKTSADIEVWMDDDAAERIVKHLESEGFKGMVTLTAYRYESTGYDG